MDAMASGCTLRPVAHARSEGRRPGPARPAPFDGRGRRRARGFTYVGALVLVAVLGVLMAQAGEVWKTAQAREREQELLYVGDQFRRAIARFYEQSPGRAKRYPRSFDELLADQRFPVVRRHLRKIFHDPVTRSTEWGVVRGPSGEIIGVHSLSDDEPVKKANFALADRDFEGRTKYSEWIFRHAPGQNKAAPGRSR